MGASSKRKRQPALRAGRPPALDRHDRSPRRGPRKRRGRSSSSDLDIVLRTETGRSAVAQRARPSAGWSWPHAAAETYRRLALYWGVTTSCYAYSHPPTRCLAVSRVLLGALCRSGEAVVITRACRTRTTREAVYVTAIAVDSGGARPRSCVQPKSASRTRRSPEACGMMMARVTPASEAGDTSPPLPASDPQLAQRLQPSPGLRERNWPTHAGHGGRRYQGDTAETQDRSNHSHFLFPTKGCKGRAA